MSANQPKPPASLRRFVNAWTELDYLCKKIRFWLYTRRQHGRAARYLDRLDRVLADLPENDSAILRAEGCALLCELTGEIGQAIAHRSREIQLMEDLHREAESTQYRNSTRSYVLRDRDLTDLQERRAILAALKKAKARP